MLKMVGAKISPAVSCCVYFQAEYELHSLVEVTKSWSHKLQVILI